MTSPPKEERSGAVGLAELQARATKTRARSEGEGKKRHSYKPLPREFPRDGFTYRQIACEGEAALYEQSWGGRADPSKRFRLVADLLDLPRFIQTQKPGAPTGSP